MQKLSAARLAFEKQDVGGPGTVAEHEASFFGRTGAPGSADLPDGGYKRECGGCKYELLSQTLSCAFCYVWPPKGPPKKSGKQVLKGIGTGKQCTQI